MIIGPLVFLLIVTSPIFALAQTPPIILPPAQVIASNIPMVFSCQRFKSKCSGASCYALVSGLQKDTGRSILDARKTEVVEYSVDVLHSIEMLKTEQVDPLLKRQLSIEYLNVENAHGKITISNKDKKGAVKEKVEITPATGFYLYYLIHTDGSIKDVPIGEPFSAYFGWCDNKSPAGAMIPDTTPVEAPATEVLTPPAATSSTMTAPTVKP